MMNPLIDNVVDENDEITKECNLLGNEGIAFQAGLAFISFWVLIIKRQREKPKRSFRVWFLDISKQGFSAATAHSLNLALAIWLAEKKSNASVDSCMWYLVTILFDTTLGVFISIAFLLLLDKLFDTCGFNSLKSGNYFKVVEKDPLSSVSQTKEVSINYLAWLLQLFFWILIVVSAKVILGFLQQYFASALIFVMNIVFSGINLFPTLKLLIVLVVAPTLGNAFQFWMSDNFLKKRDFSKDDSAMLEGAFFDNQGDDIDNKNSTSNQSTRKGSVELGKITKSSVDN